MRMSLQPALATDSRGSSSDPTNKFDGASNAILRMKQVRGGNTAKSIICHANICVNRSQKQPLARHQVHIDNLSIRRQPEDPDGSRVYELLKVQNVGFQIIQNYPSTGG